MSRMAFTVGYTKGYDGALAEATPEDPCTKTGRSDDYPGGWVWKDAVEASLFLGSQYFADAFPDRDPTTFAVYCLELPNGWDEDVYGPDPEDGVHNLINDALILGRLV